MAMVINSNIMSLNAQRNISVAQGEQDQAMERLTTGMRINSAADDAAGLAISNRMTSQVTGLDQAVRNANDGISLVQTAEGALDESTNILQRMRELSVQSANGTYDEGNRATLQAEVDQLVEELDRIAETTSFNGQSILDGSVGKVSLQVGANSNQTIDFEIEAMGSDSLGLGSTGGDVMGASMDATVAGTAASVTLAAGDVKINGQSIGEFDASTDDIADLVDSINKNVNGVTASTYVETAATSVGDGILEGTESVTITMQGLDGNETSFSVSDTENMEELVEKINDASGGLVAATINDDGEMVLSSESAQQIDVTDAAGAMGTGITTTAYAQLVLSSDDGSEITIERGDTGTLSDLEALGFNESSAQGTIEGFGMASGTTGAGAAWGVGDVTINGVTVDEENTDSLTGKIDAINAVSDDTGVTANAFAQATFDLEGINITSAVSITTGITLNGFDVDVASATDLESLAEALNAEISKTGVSATVNGTNLILESDQGAIQMELAAGTAGFVGASVDEFMAGAGSATSAISAGTATTTVTIEAGIKLTSDSGNPISVDLGDNATAAEIGLKETNTSASGAFGSSLSSIDISTAAGAQKAIDTIDNAIETVSDVRSELGAVNNRLDFTINNLSNVSENTSAALSRIQDADFAEESANLSRAQVLQQAGSAMLAQANAAPQSVLSLLQ